MKPIVRYASVAATKPATTGGPYQVRSVRRPPTYAVTAIEAVNTERTQPETSAARSRSTSTALMKIGMSTIAITSAAPTTRLASRASRRFRPPNRRGSIKGSVACRWRQANATAATAAMAYNHRRSGPDPPVSSSRPVTLWISALPSSARFSETKNTVTNTPPIQSMRDERCGRSWSASTNHAAAIRRRRAGR